MRTKLIGASLLAALASVATAGGTNLVVNGSFETPGPGFILLQGWENYGGGVFIDAGVEVAPVDGTRTVKMFGEFTGVQNDQVLIQVVPSIQAGLEYTLTGNVWHNSFDAVQPGNLILLQMVFQNSAGAAIDALQVEAIVPNSTPTDQWNPIELTGIAPTGTTQILVAVLHLQLDGLGAGATFWDDIQLVQGAGTPDCAADFNGDGTVDFFDVVSFLSAFNQGCD